MKARSAWPASRSKSTSPAEARIAGIALVHQELSLLPELTVAENIFLGREPRVLLPGFVSRGSVERAARKALAECGIAIDASAKVDHLEHRERQLVEIVKGVSASPRVLILDEPTSSLTITEVRELFAIVRRLVATRGTSIVYISHKLDEIFALADRVTVLRDGRKVASRRSANGPRRGSSARWSGATSPRSSPTRPRTPGAVRLEVEDLRRRGAFGPVSFALRAGEIVGLYGIIGAGRSELAEALFGLAPADGGTIRVDGDAGRYPLAPEGRSPPASPWLPRTATPAASSRCCRSATNLSLSALPQLVVGGFVKRRAEKAKVSEFLRTLLVRAQSAAQEVSALSGGNQQKVVLGRSLMPGPKVLILDEPTRGIDVVAKAEVHGIIDRLAHQDLAVLLISSELPEILGMSDRILVMREGKLVGEVDRAAASEERLVAMAAGAQPCG